MRRLHHTDLMELAQVIVVWMQRIDPSVNRRVVLTRLSSVFALGAVSPMLDVLNPDEYEPVVRFVQQPDTFDLPTLTYVERAIISLSRQSDVLGPYRTVHSVMGHRQLAEQLAKAAPAAFQSRAITAYAELTLSLGWECFNMGDYRSAQHYYDEARDAAHDAQNVELATYILCAMSQLAVYWGKPRAGIDHAAAAACWAERIHSPLARAYAADVAVRAYAADNQPDKCCESLDQEYTALQARTDEPTASWWYFYGEPFYWSTAARCFLKLNRPDAALSAIDQSLALADPANLRDRIFRLLRRAEVRIQQEEIAEASSIVAEVTQLTAVNGSQLIVRRVNEVRSLLTPWERTKPVRELDEQLATYRPPGGNASTKSM